MNAIYGIHLGLHIASWVSLSTIAWVIWRISAEVVHWMYSQAMVFLYNPEVFFLIWASDLDPIL